MPEDSLPEMAGLTIEGRTVLLTGASGGIGKAIARALHRKGARLTVTARREDVLEELRSELGERVEPVRADLAERADVERLCGRARETDILVANAALPASGSIESFSPEQLDRALEVNLRAPIHLARAAAPAMRERGRGHLLFMSSLSGKTASVGSSLYSATKFGIRGFAAGLREDLHGTGVGVTVVFPGFISGEGMWAEAGVELPRGVGLRSPEQVADGVVRGIESDKGEVDVAPVALRAGTLAGALAPSVTAAVQRRLGSRDVAEKLARAQEHKR